MMYKGIRIIIHYIDIVAEEAEPTNITKIQYCGTRLGRIPTLWDTHCGLMSLTSSDSDSPTTMFPQSVAHQSIKQNIIKYTYFPTFILKISVAFPSSFCPSFSQRTLSRNLSTASIVTSPRRSNVTVVTLCDVSRGIYNKAASEPALLYRFEK